MGQSFLLAIRLALSFLLDLIAIFVESIRQVSVHTTTNTFYFVVFHRLHLVLHADLIHIIFHVASLDQLRFTLA